MLGKPNTPLSQLHMQIMWSRFMAVVEGGETLVARRSRRRWRSGGPLGRSVRSRRRYTGAGGDRHAGPRQFDGRGGEAFLLDAFPLQTMRPGDPTSPTIRG